MKIKLNHPLLQHRVLIFSLFATFLLATAGMAQAAEVSGGNDMKHESHSHHQQNNIQREHIHHLHQSGSWMFEYRFMRMQMDELLDGDKNVSAEDVAKMGSAFTNSIGGNYMMAPTAMKMDMHMLMAMYSQSDDLSWMAMVSYLNNKMDMITMSGASLVMESSGIGDLRVGAMYKLYDENSSQLLTNLELSLPTGSITKENSQGILPYAMQLGSGTYDLIPSVTYQKNYDDLNWGVQGSHTFRLSKNNQNYALGNRTDGQAWIKVNPLKDTSVTGRVTFSDLKKVAGNSDAITMMLRNMSPTFDVKNSGGTRWDASIGISHIFESGHTLGVEYGVPIQQKLNGLQMKMTRMYSVSWQYLL